MLLGKQNDLWESISDLMTGLMMVFLFVTIAYMFQLEQAQKQAIEVRSEIMAALAEEFTDEDLAAMGAKINYESGKMIFDLQPDINFDVGSSKVKPAFKNVLNNFFPRYIKVLTSEKFESKISGIKIEGSASFESDSDAAYFRDMKLSQERATNVLQYVYYLPGVKDKKDWIRKHVSANGLSYANAKKVGAREDRKVEFSFRTNDEELAKKIPGVILDED